MVIVLSQSLMWLTLKGQLVQWVRTRDLATDWRHSSESFEDDRS